MSTLRRNILRLARPLAAIDVQRQRLQAKLAKAEAIVERWWKRLNRAIHAVDKQRKQIARLHRQIQQLIAGSNGQAASR